VVGGSPSSSPSSILLLPLPPSSSSKFLWKTWRIIIGSRVVGGWSPPPDPPLDPPLVVALSRARVEEHANQPCPAAEPCGSSTTLELAMTRRGAHATVETCFVNHARRATEIFMASHAS
jgi:hypothetical protein